MSESIRLSSQDYSKFDNMSTEDLNEYLRKDSYLQNSSESDIEEILYVMKVLAKREINENKYNFSDVRASWDSFNDNYCIEDNDGRSLYEFDDEPNTPVVDIPNSKIVHKTIKESIKSLISIAAVICVILVGSITANALGYDIWDAIIVWTKDTFGFETGREGDVYPTPYVKQIPEELNELNNLMSEYGLPSGIIPSYIPTGYKMADLKCDKLSDTSNIFCQLSNGSNDITLLYRTYLGDSISFQLEKDTYSPEIYELNGVTYYIMSNLSNYFVSWLSGNTECAIMGVPTYDELIRIINSLNSA